MFCWGAPPRRRKMPRLRARGGGVSRSRARVTFVPGDKSNQKRHLKLRFKTSLRGEGKCKFDGADFAEWARWVSLSVQGIACTSCAAAADAVWR